jgi:hypothetical protein
MSIPDPDGRVYACVSLTDLNAYKGVRLLDRQSGNGQCPTGWTMISWSAGGTTAPATATAAEPPAAEPPAGQG